MINRRAHFFFFSGANNLYFGMFRHYKLSMPYFCLLSGNCMEKLLEVLIAIKDEPACLSVAELMLKHWPSHSRALHVKQTILESDPISFAPRGVDKLQPQHVRLKFPDKRKSTDECGEETQSAKRLCRTLEIQLTEVSWMSLVDAILKIDNNALAVSSDLLFPNGNHDIRLCITMQSTLACIADSLETTVDITQTSAGNCSDWSSKVKEKEGNSAEEPLQERRSTRLESLRSRKPGKEGMDVTHGKDSTKVVRQTLEPFLVDGLLAKDPSCASSSRPLFGPDCSMTGHEEGDVSKFVARLSKNYGACHVAHLILEEVASRCLSYQEYFVKFMELDQLARSWGQDRTTKCSLFLAELYYDACCLSVDKSQCAHLFSESSYHLCKVIELVALEAPFNFTHMWGNNINKDIILEMFNLNDQPESIDNSKYVHSADESQFWIRFFWLSGRLSVYSGDKEKAYREFSVALSLLEDWGGKEDHQYVIPFPHCKLIRCISSERLMHEINLLKLESCMNKAINQMIEGKLYTEIVKLLSPLLLCNNDIYLDLLLHACKEGEGIDSVELSALNVLILACDRIKPMEIEVHLNSHRQKLQLLAAAAGMVEFPASPKPICKNAMQKLSGSSDIEGLDSRYISWAHTVAEELKAISTSLSLMKSFIDQNASSVSI